MQKRKRNVTLFALLSSLLAGVIALPAFAADRGDGIAAPWQLNFQTPATPVMERLNDTHTMLLWIITAICVFVLAALIYICVRFRRKANPVASKTTHNAKLEVIWTAIPILRLIVIAIPSLRLHYYMDKPVDPEMTIKVVGYQWYWHYQYPDHGGFEFDSYMKKDEELKDGEPRLLEVDNHLVVPVDTNIRVLMTAADVIHAWAMPAFGVKRDAIPGRLNESWFKATRTGRFYGQCSELCGVGHGFMPIVVDVVEKDEFAQWVAGRKADAGIVDEPADETASPTATAPATATPVAEIAHDVLDAKTKAVKAAAEDDDTDQAEATPTTTKSEE